MKTMTKGLVGTVAAGAMALSLASPAAAQQRHRDRDGIDAGEVIAGALIIGGIAAIIAAASDDDDRRYRDDDRRYRDYDYRRSGYDDYDRRGNARQAVDQCVRTAERQANRVSRGGRADVTDIRDIDRNRNGFTIKGRIAVSTRDWRRGDNYRGRGWDNDYRGYSSSRHSGYDSGRFTCRVRNGRVVDLDFSGIRGLR